MRIKKVVFLSFLILNSCQIQADLFTLWSEFNARNRQAVLDSFTENPNNYFNTSTQLVNEKKTFKDIIGGVPQEITDLIAILKDDEYYAALGIETPKGILFAGPPGTGKTLLASALAGELHYEFISVSGSEFTTKWVGSGVENIKNLFDRARSIIKNKQSEKVIIFIDELDSIGQRSQDSFNTAVQSDFNRTINELLRQMDGMFTDPADIAANKNIIVIGATNFEQAIDPALRRAGRFSRLVTIPLPDQAKRTAIISHYLNLKKRNLAPNVDLKKWGEKTHNFNCADLKDFVERAAVNAARCKRKVITNLDFEIVYQEMANQKH